ncbi:hypothetical protein BVRB_1g003530 [Beta vulgaris subsp. vulgaris]|nr:hypothetical protein BVRB_1g003530 [Beta vulgaris subsp. vulgaris]
MVRCLSKKEISLETLTRYHSNQREEQDYLGGCTLGSS